MRPLTAILSIGLFSAFGYIGAYQQANHWIIIGFAAALGLVAIALLQGVMMTLSPVAKADPAMLQQALQQGLLYMLPFATLALLADVVLAWQSAQAFLSAGLSTVAITSGGALVKNGGSKWVSILVPMIWAMAVSAAWILVVTLYR